MSQDIIEKWLENISASVASRDLAAHMALVSKKVRVYGLPGGKVISYSQWKKRRQNEFAKKQLQSLTYTLSNIKTITSHRLAFRVNEVMQATKGMRVNIDKDIILELEDDAHWRVVEEKINHWHIEIPE